MSTVPSTCSVSRRAWDLHNLFGLTWLGMFFFFVFWMFVTHEYKQYIPTTKKLFEVARYYASGIFKGEPHPVHKSESAKHNPMQRLTYLGLTAVLLPFQMITGLLYWGYNDWADWGLSWLSLDVVALLHLIGGFFHSHLPGGPHLHDHHRAHGHRARGGDVLRLGRGPRGLRGGRLGKEGRASLTGKRIPGKSKSPAQAGLFFLWICPRLRPAGVGP